MKRLLVFVCLFIVCTSGAKAVEYRVRDLGIGVGGSAMRINDNGMVVGYYRTSPQGMYTTYVLDNGQLITPTDMSLGAVNNKGQILGISADMKGHALLWEGGNVTDLGIVQEIYGSLGGLNDKGEITGYHSDGWDKYAFLWRPEGVTHIGTLGGYTTTPADVNNLSHVVGESSTANYKSHAFFWEDGRITDLAVDPDEYSRAYAINDLDQIVGELLVSQSGPFVFAPVLWQNGERVMLPLLNGINGEATDINNEGQIVGWVQPADSTTRAVTWIDGVAYQLEALPGGINCSAHAINNNGVICGFSGAADGQYHAVLWEPVPEPSSILALMSGLGGLGLILRRRAARA